MGRKGTGDESCCGNTGGVFQCEVMFRQFLSDDLHSLCEEGIDETMYENRKGMESWRLGKRVKRASLIHKRINWEYLSVVVAEETIFRWCACGEVVFCW